MTLPLSHHKSISVSLCLGAFVLNLSIFSSSLGVLGDLISVFRICFCTFGGILPHFSHAPAQIARRWQHGSNPLN